MSFGKIEKRVIDGKVFVSFDDLIQALYVVANQALDVAELTQDATLIIQTKGLIDVATGLDNILDAYKQEKGLARYR